MQKVAVPVRVEMKNRIDYNIILLSLILLAVFFLVFPTVQKVEFRPEYDEGYYFKYADYISGHGLGGFKALFSDYIYNKENWAFPNPLRIGYIILCSIWLKFLGASFYSLAHLSFISYVLFVAICFYFSARHFDKFTALLIALLTAFSPINMAMSRRALCESPSALFLGLSIWLFLDVMHKDGSLAKKIFFTIAFSSAVLIKETNIFLIAPFIIYGAIYNRYYGKRNILNDLLFIVVFPAIIAVTAYIIFSGNASSVLKVIKIILVSPKTNEYAIKYGSGPWYRYIMDFMMLSPWVVVLSIGYMFNLLACPGKIGSKENYFVILFVSLFILFNFFTKNIRYAMILDLPMRVFSILALYRFINIKSSRGKYVLITVIVLLICAADYFSFYDLFIKKGIYDPVSMWLLLSRNIISWE